MKNMSSVKRILDTIPLSDSQMKTFNTFLILKMWMSAHTECIPVMTVLVQTVKTQMEVLNVLARMAT